jgi:hypothetical protein
LLGHARNDGHKLVALENGYSRLFSRLPLGQMIGQRQRYAVTQRRFRHFVIAFSRMLRLPSLSGLG